MTLEEREREKEIIDCFTNAPPNERHHKKDLKRNFQPNANTNNDDDSF